MGYFSNATEHDLFHGQQCAHCLHRSTDEKPCAVESVHVLLNYDQHDNEKLKTALDLLITRVEDGTHNECNMFIDRAPERCHDTPDMFDTK